MTRQPPIPFAQLLDQADRLIAGAPLVTAGEYQAMLARLLKAARAAKSALQSTQALMEALHHEDSPSPGDLTEDDLVRLWDAVEEAVNAALDGSAVLPAAPGVKAA